MNFMLKNYRQNFLTFKTSRYITFLPNLFFVTLPSVILHRIFNYFRKYMAMLRVSLALIKVRVKTDDIQKNVNFFKGRDDSRAIKSRR